MSKQPRDFTQILLNRLVISHDQLGEACSFAQEMGTTLRDALVKLGYATAEQVMSAVAESRHLLFIDLAHLTIAPAVFELVPESVARENVILPVAGGKGGLLIAISDPDDSDTIQKLQFILNKNVYLVLATREQIIEAINRHYGQTETESVDSMLREFTDTAIDFTQTDFEVPELEESGSGRAALEGSSELELTLDDEDSALALEDGGQLQCFAKAVRSRPVERQATVRYYHRMNPERMFPLLVVLSKKHIAEVVKRGVSQARSKGFQVALDSVVEVEPILPGCSCYPPKEQMPVREAEVSSTFWVVPHVLGKIMQARVVVRQNGTVLAEVPLEMRVVKQGVTLLLGALSLVLPLLLLVLKQYHLDFESQLQEGFGLYAQALNWAVRSLSPEVLTGLLLALTAMMYFWLRPRKRDVFWDIETISPEELARQKRATVPVGDWTPGAELAPRVQEPEPDSQPDLFRRADQLFAQQDYRQALDYYERGLALGTAKPIVYFRASLSACHLDDNRRALAILEEARAQLPPSTIPGVMWYNMGCFATRLGRFPEAIRYLNRAVDAGFNNVAKLRSDPDLAPLRWRADFKRLLVSVASS
jgi:tetratricopeptide (TPR) repeat protein